MRPHPTSRLALSLFFFLAPALSVRADADETEESGGLGEVLVLLREKGILSDEEYETLYRRQAKHEASVEAKSALPGWVSGWTFGGDARLRWDRLDYGHEDNVGPGRVLVI